MAGRVLTCPQCGASLKWQGVAAVVECRYCNAHVVTESGQRTDLQAQATAQRPVSPLPFILLGGLMFAGIAASVAFSALGPDGATVAAEVPGLSMSEVAKVDLEVSQAEMAKKLGVEPKNNHVFVPVDDDEFVSFNVGYEDEMPKQASYVSLQRHKDAPLPESIVKRLSEQLGPKMERVDGGISYSVPGVHIGSSGGGLLVSLHNPEAKGAPKAFLLGWKVVLYGVRGKGKIGIDDARDHLARGYPLKLLQKLDGGHSFEQAPKLLDKQFPATTQDGASFSIPIEPGNFHSLRLDYENSAGGRLKAAYLHIYPRSGASAKSVAKCLDKVLGAGEETVTDFAKGESNWRWQVAGQTTIHLQGMGMYVSFGGSDRKQLSNWLSKMEKCA